MVLVCLSKIQALELRCTDSVPCVGSMGDSSFCDIWHPWSQLSAVYEELFLLVSLYCLGPQNSILQKVMTDKMG